MSGGKAFRQVFDLPMPTSVNAMYRRGRGRTYISAEYAKWKNAAGWIYATSPARRAASFTGPYTVHIILGSIKRRGDCDNRIKPVLDALVSWGVTPDDKHCEKATAEWGEAPAGMCRVIIEAVEPADVQRSREEA